MNEQAKYPTYSTGTMMWEYIVATLDKASIPSVMFGWNCMYVYGCDLVGAGLQTPDFVVADESLIDARSALVAAGFLECQDSLCDIRVNQEPFGSAVHLHIPATMCVGDIEGWYDNNFGTKGIIRLKRHSATLPKITDLNPAKYGGRQDIMLASDPENEPDSRDPPHAVRVPSLHRFYEAVLLLLWENDTWYGQEREADATYWFFVLRQLNVNCVVSKRLHREMLTPAMRLFITRAVPWGPNENVFSQSRYVPPLDDSDDRLEQLYRDLDLEEAEYKRAKKAVAAE